MFKDLEKRLERLELKKLSDTKINVIIDGRPHKMDFFSAYDIVTAAEYLREHDVKVTEERGGLLSALLAECKDEALDNSTIM